MAHSPFTGEEVTTGSSYTPTDPSTSISPPSSTTPPPPSPRRGVHLIVCSHGMWGRPKDVEYLANSLSERLQGEKVVLVSQVSSRW